MNVIAIADDDSQVGRMQRSSAKLLISLGDLLDSTIEKAQQVYGCLTVFAVKGNHDSASPFHPTITDLHFTVVEHKGICFGGFCGCWKYKPQGPHLFEQQEVIRALRWFPAVDVFIAHNSPRGVHERDPDVHQGFDGFHDYIERVRPRYFIHGHQHTNRVTTREETTIIGVYGEAELELNLEDR